MNIQHEDNGTKGAFYIKLENERVAEMTYVWAGEHRLIIDHTEVLDVLKGKGAGKQLLEAMIAFSRSNGHKITPLCPFAKAMFDKTPAYADVLW